MAFFFFTKVARNFWQGTLTCLALDKALMVHFLQVWNLGSSVPNYTLEGHDKGVNCVSYYYGGEKPYLISGADDRLVKIWDYQNKSCVQTLEGHNQNISCVMFHPELPIICTGSEDGTVRLWHANTYKQVRSPTQFHIFTFFWVRNQWLLVLISSNTLCRGFS